MALTIVNMVENTPWDFNQPRKMSREAALGLLPRTKYSEWFVLGLEYAGLWVNMWNEGDDWCVSVCTTKPGVYAVAVNETTTFRRKTIRGALRAMARTYGSALSEGRLYVELYRDVYRKGWDVPGDVSAVRFPKSLVVRFPKSLAELRMKMELAGFDLGELGGAKRKRKAPENRRK